MKRKAILILMAVILALALALPLMASVEEQSPAIPAPAQEESVVPQEEALPPEAMPESVPEEPADAPAPAVKPETPSESAQEAPAPEAGQPADQGEAAPVDNPEADAPEEEPAMEAQPEEQPVEEQPAEEQPAEEQPVEEPAPAQEEDPGVLVGEFIDQHFADRVVSIYADLGGKEAPGLGDLVVFTARLKGYEGLQYSLRWQMSRDNLHFEDLTGQNGSVLPLVLDEDNCNWFLRVAVDITGLVD